MDVLLSNNYDSYSMNKVNEVGILHFSRQKVEN